MPKKLKILFTIPNFDTAGSGQALLKIATLLDKNIFNPEIACLHNRGDFFEQVVQSGIKIHIINLYIDARPIIKMLFGSYKLSKIFKKINPHLIHSYHYAADYTEPLAAKFAGIKWIYTKKNMSWKGPSYRSWKLRSWLADGIISQNKEMNKTFFNNSKKVSLIPIGVEVNKYKNKSDNNNKIRSKWGLQSNSRIIVSIANLTPIKGIEILIKAFESLITIYSNWELIIVGDYNSNYGIKLKEYVQNRRKISNKIFFTGKQKNIKDLLDIAEIYVQPSMSKGEGAPISILEAMSNGKVIIGSNVSGIKDQLEDFPDHLFVAESIPLLIEKLNHYMSNSLTTNIQLGKLFFKYVLNKFDISNEKIKIEELYKEIINS